MSEPSGVQWCARFPTSKSTADLAPPFRDAVLAFLSQLGDSHANVSIQATLRPPQRAYLMHWAWGIARGLPKNMCRPGDVPNRPIDPATVGAMAGVDIDWTHGGDPVAAKAAAAKMVQTYGMAAAAALNGRHIEGHAIDMNISWSGTLAIRDFNGQTHNIASTPRDGTNTELNAVGKTFGVIKLLKIDPPHWSIDGR